jgi:hypothetical protein
MRRLWQIDRPLTRLHHAAASRPRWTVAAFAALAAASIALTTRLSPGSGIEVFFSVSDPSGTRMKRVMEDFSVADDLLVLAEIEGDQIAMDTDRAARLQAFAQRLASAVQADEAGRRLVGHVAWRPGDQARAFAQAHIVPNAALHMTDESWAELERRLTPAGMAQTIARSRRLLSGGSPVGAAAAGRIMRDPLRIHELVLDRVPATGPAASLWNDGPALIDPAARRILVRLSGARPAADLDFSGRLMSAARRLAERVNTDGLRLRFAGGYAVADHNHRMIRADMIGNVAVSGAMLAGLFLLVYRGLWTIARAFVPVAGGIVIGLGALATTTDTITPVVAAIGGILAGLGLDYTLHALSALDRSATSGRGAVRPARLTRGQIAPMLAAVATSAIGFAIVAMSGVEALRQFGWLATAGLTAIFLGSITLLPAMARGGGAAAGVFRPAARRLMDLPVEWCARRRRACGVMFTGIVVVCVGVIAWGWSGWKPFEDDLHSLHPQPSPPLEAQRLIVATFGAVAESWPIHVQAESPDDVLAACREVERRIMEQRGRAPLAIAGVIGPHQLLPDPVVLAERRRRLEAVSVDRVIADLATALRGAGFRPEAFREYEGHLRRMLRPGPGPTRADLAEYPDLHRQLLPRGEAANPDQALVWLRLEQPAQTRSEQEAMVEFLRSCLAGEERAAAVGQAVARQAIERLARRLAPIMLVVSLTGVMAWMLIQQRSVRAGIAAATPVGFALLALAAMMIALDQRLNLVNMIAMPMLVGVGVDYGIFTVAWARGGARARRAGHASAHAVTLCAATTLLGFGSLVTSHTPAIQSLGVTMLVGISACWAGCFLALIPMRSARAGDPGPGSRDDSPATGAARNTQDAIRYPLNP